MVQKVLVGRNATKRRTGKAYRYGPLIGAPRKARVGGYRRSYPNPRGKELLVRRVSTHITRATVS